MANRTVRLSAVVSLLVATGVQPVFALPRGDGFGAVIGGLSGGVAAVVHGGSFEAGFNAGAAAAAAPGGKNAAQGWAAGINVAEQGGSEGLYRGRRSDGESPNGNAWGRNGRQDNVAMQNGREEEILNASPQAQAQAQQVQVAAANSTFDLTPAQVAALAAQNSQTNTVTVNPASTTDPVIAGVDRTMTDEEIRALMVKEGKGPFAPQPNSQPAPPSSVSGLDVPKRYQVNVPPVPPGVEVKGGQAAADAQTARLKLNGDAVASAFGTTVDLQAIKAPASMDHGTGLGAERRAGDVNRSRLDPRDHERALRQTVTSGQARFGLKDYNGAVAEAEAAIEQAPKNPEGYLLYAKTLNRMGAHTKAEEMARMARKLARNTEEQALAQSELTQALLYQDRVGDALASAAETVRLGQLAGNKTLEANGMFLQAAACELKGDKDCVIKSLSRAAYLDTKYYAALEAAKAGKKIFDPNDKESLGLLDSVGDSGLPMPVRPRALVGGLLAFVAGLAGLAGLAWRRSRQEAAKAAIANAMGVKKDDGLLAGKYVLGKPVSLEGGGDAWEAEDRSLGRHAIVVKLSNPAAAEEAKRLASVHHPGVVDVFEILDTPKGQFVVRENLKGRTFKQVLAGRGKVGFAEARRLLAPVCEALEAARGQGVVCGGFTLSSAMLCDEGYVKVTDLSSHATRGDVQALASALAELVTGRPHRPDVPLAGAAPELSTLLMDAAAGRIPGPAAFSSRLVALGESVHAG